MYPSVLTLLTLLPLALSAVPPKSHPRKATKPSSSVSARDIYDTTLARLASRHGRDKHLQSKIRSFEDPHAGQKKVRRKKRGSDCQIPVSASSVIGGQDAVATGLPVAASSTSADKNYTASSTSSNAAVATSASSGSSSGGQMDWLFPMQGSASWTTCTDASSAISFTGALKPLSAGKLPSASTAPDGSSALVANYPANTFGLSNANGGQGFSFYTLGAVSGVNVQAATEVIFSYSVYFDSNFDFVKGGKMPGLYGGTSLSEAKSCSGGRQDGRDECFSARMMWRTDGAGEFYNYFPTSITQGGTYCSTPPYSICDTTYGDSIGRGSYSWTPGAWTTVALRFKLNSPGNADGEQQLWVNGQSVLSLSGLQQSVSGDTKIYGIMAQTFFGGHDNTWESPKDQSAWFKDWSLEILA